MKLWHGILGVRAQEDSRMVLRYLACSLGEQWCLRKHWGGTGTFLFSKGKGGEEPRIKNLPCLLDPPGLGL